MAEEYGLEIAEQIENGLITEEQYLHLAKVIGEHHADTYVLALTEPYALTSQEIATLKKDIDEKQQRKRARLKTLEEAREKHGVPASVDTGVLDLQKDAHDDFVWDSILYVDGHSDIDVGVLKKYSAIGDISVVTILGSAVGGFCFASDLAMKKVKKDIQPNMTPMDVAILLNTLLREDPLVKKHIEKHADVDVFLKSSVQLSDSTEEYYERDWDFFETVKGKVRPMGSVQLQNASGVHSLLMPEERGKTTLTKTEMIRRAYKHGAKRLLFIDIGCLDFKNEKAKEFWTRKKNHILGGKTKRRI